MSLATTASPKPSFRAPRRVDDAVVGTGNAGWATSKSGHPCPCQNCWHRPLAEKAGRGSLLNRPLCLPNDPIGQGTGLNWTDNGKYLSHNSSVSTGQTTGKHLPVQVRRIRLKIEQDCRLFLDIFISAIMNDLFMTFTSRLKVDVKCVYQQWNWITVTNYFGTPPADWVHGYLYFELGAWIWTKGFRRYLNIVKTNLEIFL